MGYVVDFDALDSMYNSIGSQANSWMEELKAVKEKFQVLVDTDNMSGAGATNIKNYISNTHMILIGLVLELISLHATNCLLYKNDYQTNIDTGLHAFIKSSEIDDCLEQIESTRKKAICIDESIAFALGKIRDIFYVSYADVTTVDAEHKFTSRFLSTLDQDIKSLENRHSLNDFTYSSELISALTGFINELTASSRTYKTEFSTDSLISSNAFLQLYNSHIKVSKELEEKADEISEAIENENQHVADLQKEYEERQKEAKIINSLVTVGCVVGSIALIGFTGGAASPVAVGLISAASGAVMAGTSNLTAQYVQYGNIIENADKVDWGSFGKDVFVASVAGFATGALGTGASNAITGGLSKSAQISAALHSSSGVVRIGTNALIGATSQVGAGIVSRGAGTLISTGGDLGAACDAAFDKQHIFVDATIGGVSAGVKEYTSTKQAQEAADKCAAEYNDKYKPYEKAQAAGYDDLKQTANGGIDYEESSHILRNESGEPASVRIKATGNRDHDYEAAEKILKEQGWDVDFESMRKGSDKTHVWHHVDDYNASTNELTMQFVDTKVHGDFRHAGSAAQYHAANGTGYQKIPFDADYGYDPTYTTKKLKELAWSTAGTLNGTQMGISGAAYGFRPVYSEINALSAKFESLGDLAAAL